MAVKRVRAYFKLLKFRMTVFIALCVALGYFYARPEYLDLPQLLGTIAGSCLLAFSAFAGNQIIERSFDKKMERTKGRPLPAGLISIAEACLLGVLCFLAGSWLLWRYGNGLALAVGIAIVVSYCFLYTPLKRVSTLNTLAGAVPGALPPLIGWAVVRENLSGGAFVLFAILFFWQLPHFLAIAWLHRRDYGRGEFQMLSVTDPSGDSCFRQIVMQTVLLIGVTLVPFLAGMAGMVYLLIALLAGFYFLYSGLALLKSGSDGAARRVFHYSLLYLPCILLSLILDQRAL